MPLLTRMLASPLFVDVRRGAIEDLAHALAERHISADGRVLLSVGPDQGRRIYDQLRPTLPHSDVHVVRQSSIGESETLQDQLQRHDYDAVVGIGGGRTIDVTKYAATRSGVPMVAVATSLAHDGICSPVASLENEHGKGSYGVAMPLAVIVDLDYVRRAPAPMVRAGIGDVISNLSAIEDWKLAHRQHGDPIDGLAIAFAGTAARSMLDRDDGIDHDDFLQALAQALILSGMAMEVAGTSQPCSGACHEIVHAVDALYPGSAGHGELAGLGALFAIHLRDDGDLFDRVLDCLRRHDLPVLPADVGLNEEQFLAALMHAPHTRPGRYTILEHLGLGRDAMLHRLRGYHERVGSASGTTQPATGTIGAAPVRSLTSLGVRRRIPDVAPSLFE